jgi:hypothetical protein
LSPQGTVEARVHTITGPSHERLHLIDTPGFEDTNKLNGDILKEIAYFLGIIYKLQLGEIIGLIYMHRITDPRVSGSALRSFRLFERLCGTDRCESMYLVTTMWDQLGEKGQQVGELRQSMLKDKAQFWRDMIAKGAIVLQRRGNEASTNDILHKIFERGKRCVMRIQEEFVTENRALDQTTAGAFLTKEVRTCIDKVRAEMNKLEGSLKSKLKCDEDYVSMAMEQKRKLE